MDVETGSTSFYVSVNPAGRYTKITACMGTRCTKMVRRDSDPDDRKQQLGEGDRRMIVYPFEVDGRRVRLK